MERDNRVEISEIIPVLIMAFFFIIIHGLALTMVDPFVDAGLESTFEDKDDPVNLVYFFVIILVMTAIILLIAKYWKKQLIQFIILGAVGYTAFYAFFLPVFGILLPMLSFWIVAAIAIAAAAVLVLALFKYPE